MTKYQKKRVLNWTWGARDVRFNLAILLWQRTFVPGGMIVCGRLAQDWNLGSGGVSRYVRECGSFLVGILRKDYVLFERLLNAIVRLITEIPIERLRLIGHWKQFTAPAVKESSPSWLTIQLKKSLRDAIWVLWIKYFPKSNPYSELKTSKVCFAKINSRNSLLMLSLVKT